MCTKTRPNAIQTIILLVLVSSQVEIILTVEYEFRLDMLPPCPENMRNGIRIEKIDYKKMNNNRFSTNGSFVVNKEIDKRLQVCSKIDHHCITILFVLHLHKSKYLHYSWRWKRHAAATTKMCANHLVS